MSFAYFFGAAAGGFILMAAIGLQALVALFSSIPLVRRHKAENPEFNAGRAYRRIAMVVVIVFAIFAVITLLVAHYVSTAALLGFLVGLVLAFLMSLKRLSPDNELNQKNFEDSYVDCYPLSALNPDDLDNASPDAEPPAGEDDPPESKE